MKVDIMICTKDRPSEVAILLQSLRTQTHQDFDIYIFDDRSGAPIQQHHFLATLINRMKLENHMVILMRNDLPLGVTRLRQQLVDKIMKIGVGDAILRLDDDNILEPDYIEKLIETLDAGYDIASGVVPTLGMTPLKRQTKFVKPFISDVELGADGRIISFADDCGVEYLDSEIIPSPNFRSMALMKKSVHEKVKYEDNLGFCSFREEQFFSFKALVEGFKIGVHTGAVAYHMQTPSGGERTPEYQNNLQRNNEIMNKFCIKLFEKHGDFLKKYREGFK